MNEDHIFSIPQIQKNQKGSIGSPCSLPCYGGKQNILKEMIEHNQILTNTVHTAPTTKQATNPFKRVVQPKVEASFTDCIDRVLNEWQIHDPVVTKL